MPSDATPMRLPILGSIGAELARAFHRAGRAAVESRYARWARTAAARGTTDAPRTPPLIISLTSFAPRFATLPVVIESLLRQTCRPDRLILWLAGDVAAEELPATLGRQEARGLEIRYTDDLRSFLKLVPTLEAHPDAAVVTADDDVVYPADWLARLHDAHTEDPQSIPCHRAHQMTWTRDGALRPYDEWKKGAPGLQGPSHDLFATSGAGMYLPPGSLPPTALDRSLFLRLCPTADDVWWMAMLALAGRQVRKVSPASLELHTIRRAQGTALRRTNLGSGGGNDTQLHAVLDHFDLHDRIRVPGLV